MAGILERVRGIRHALEDVITRTQFDPMISSLLDQAVALDEAVMALLAESNTAAPAHPDPAAIVSSIVPSRLASSCPRCGSPRICCKGSAAPGDPADHHEGAEG
jgi:hypothetical protein